MIIAIIFFGLILAGHIIFHAIKNESPLCIGTALTGVALGILIAIEIDTSNKENIPSALDVYQGKTTLRITYQDSIAVDSIVVFKEKEK